MELNEALKVIKEIAERAERTARAAEAAAAVERRRRKEQDAGAAAEPGSGRGNMPGMWRNNLESWHLPPLR
jgi:hypothetical protein